MAPVGSNQEHSCYDVAGLISVQPCFLWAIYNWTEILRTYSDTFSGNLAKTHAKQD